MNTTPKSCDDDYAETGSALSRKARTRISALVGFAAFILAWARWNGLDTAPLRSFANDNECSSRQKQLASAMLQYASDYDNVFPAGISNSRRGVGWAGAIFPYVRSTSAYVCPEFMDSQCISPPYLESYAYNSNVAGISRQQLDAPRATVLLFDIEGPEIRLTESEEGYSHGARVFSPAGDGTIDHLYTRAKGLRGSVTYSTGLMGKRESRFGPLQDARHGISSPIAFADGHVGWESADDVSTGANAVNAADPQTGIEAGRAAGTKNQSFRATFSIR